MARRLKFEGANVLGVVEILPYASGLPRNVVKCLNDYDIPLFLNHTITCIEGKERLEQVTIAQVDENINPIKGTEKHIQCDTLLLSLGLIPENEISKNVGIELDLITCGPIVDQHLETTLDGVFACGNCLQVYDTVDMLSIDAKRAGKHAAENTSIRKRKQKLKMRVIPSGEIRYVVPQQVDKPGIVPLTFRVKRPTTNGILRVIAGDKELVCKKMRWINPANMIRFEVKITTEIFASAETLKVIIDEK